MTLDGQSDQRSTPDLTAALNLLWIRFLPEIRERVATLEAAAQFPASGNLAPEMRQAAHSAAHKLAGSLGMFNLSSGTDLAREFEHACVLDVPRTEEQVARLKTIAAELRAIVESRA